MNTHNFSCPKSKHYGQGMTEYIVIMALIAVAAITAYNLFGNSSYKQVGHIVKPSNIEMFPAATKPISDNSMPEDFYKNVALSTTKITKNSQEEN